MSRAVFAVVTNGSTAAVSDAVHCRATVFAGSAAFVTSAGPYGKGGFTLASRESATPIFRPSG